MVLTREDQSMDMEGEVGVEAPEGLASDSCGKVGEAEETMQAGE